MKLIIAFALIVAVSCDVSHVVQGDGWFKDASGYHYNKPETRFTEEVAVEEVIAADVPVTEELAVVAEPEAVIADEVAEPIIGSDEPVVVEIAPEVPAEPVIVEEIVTADAPVEPEIVAEVVADPIPEVLPEVKVSNEYLPPATDAKKKRQIPVRRVVRKVYRRFVPVKRH